MKKQAKVKEIPMRVRNEEPMISRVFHCLEALGDDVLVAMSRGVITLHHDGGVEYELRLRNLAEVQSTPATPCFKNFAVPKPGDRLEAALEVAKVMAEAHKKRPRSKP